jgi:hypothetical protein
VTKPTNLYYLYASTIWHDSVARVKNFHFTQAYSLKMAELGGITAGNIFV